MAEKYQAGKAGLAQPPGKTQSTFSETAISPTAALILA